MMNGERIRCLKCSDYFCESVEGTCDKAWACYRCGYEEGKPHKYSHHTFKTCPMLYCRICKTHGHLVSRCPSLEEKTDKLTCKFCEGGHDTAKCRELLKQRAQMREREIINVIHQHE